MYLFRLLLLLIRLLCLGLHRVCLLGLLSVLLAWGGGDDLAVAAPNTFSTSPQTRLGQAQTQPIWLAMKTPSASASMQSDSIETLRIGSKRFTESYILTQLLSQQTKKQTGQLPRVMPGLGNTAIAYQALQTGSIDLYPEYAGTIALEILRRASPLSREKMQAALAPLGLGVSIPFGFNDSYALAMRATEARRLGISRISDLAMYPTLRFGLSSEFIGRADGWQGLAQRYSLHQTPRSLDHGLAYEAMRRHQVDVMDVYTTDAKIEALGLRTLVDDRAYFHRYDALVLYRLDVPKRFPQAWRAMQALTGMIDETTMINMNARAELQGVSFAVIAQDRLMQIHAPQNHFIQHETPHDFLMQSDPTPDHLTRRHPSLSYSTQNNPSQDHLVKDNSVQSYPTEACLVKNNSAQSYPAQECLVKDNPAQSYPISAPSPHVDQQGFLVKLIGPDLGRLALQHSLLVVIAVGVATLFAIPAGMLVQRRPRWQAMVLGIAGLLQTVPALAMLAVLISVTGQIGTLPALAALTLYALLPVMRNTCVGLNTISPGLRMAAIALGMTSLQRMYLIEFPLARAAIVAGIRTATSMAIGTATIAAFIGAGGFGERIVMGLALNDWQLLLAGALPAAAMAVASELLFEWVAWRLRAPGH